MKNNTTSILLNVVASIIAIILLFSAIALLAEKGYISGLLLLLTAIIVSPLPKILFKKVKPLTIRIVRVIAPIILFTIAGAFIQKDTLNNNLKTNPSTVDQEKIYLVQLKDSLNAILEPKKLDVCTIIKEINTLELEAIKQADKKYPNFEAPQHGNLSEKLRISKTNSYLKKKQLSESLYDKVLTFVNECSEADRKAKIQEDKIQQMLLQAEKNKIDECYKASCSIVPDKIKASLHNPKSFEKVNCKYLGSKGNTFSIRITYRGENAFGVIRTEKAIATIDIETCNLIEIK
jgi:hypothetical protein